MDKVKHFVLLTIILLSVHKLHAQRKKVLRAHITQLTNDSIKLDKMNNMLTKENNGLHKLIQSLELEKASLNRVNQQLEEKNNLRIQQIRNLKNSLFEMHRKSDSIKTLYDACMVSKGLKFFSQKNHQIDSNALIKWVNAKFNNLCSEENLSGQKDCNYSIEANQYFQIGNKRYLLVMVNSTFNGSRMQSGKSIFMLFSVVIDKIQLLDKMLVDDCNQFGGALHFPVPKSKEKIQEWKNSNFSEINPEIYEIGKFAFAWRLSGCWGAPGYISCSDYFVTVVEDKISLPYIGKGGSGRDNGMGVVDDDLEELDLGEWYTDYEVIPSNNEFMSLRATFNKTSYSNGEKSTTTKVIKFSRKNIFDRKTLSDYTQSN